VEHSGIGMMSAVTSDGTYQNYMEKGRKAWN
jgi:hypothetical protein